MTKELLLRYGGAAAFRRATPIFVGLIVGDIFIQACWTLIGAWSMRPSIPFLSESAVSLERCGISRSAETCRRCSRKTR
jgi:hypothetical protein